MWPSAFEHHQQRHWVPELSVAGPPLPSSPQWATGCCHPHSLQNGLKWNSPAVSSVNLWDFQLLLTPALPLLQVASAVILNKEGAGDHGLIITCLWAAYGKLPLTHFSFIFFSPPHPLKAVIQQSLHHTPPFLHGSQQPVALSLTYSPISCHCHI